MDILIDLNLKPVNYEYSIDHQTEKRLRSLFTNDIRDLERLIKKDLSSWILK